MQVVKVNELPLYEAERPFTRLNKVILSPSEGKGSVSVGLGIYRVGERSEMHVHSVEEEIMYFTRGTGRMTLENGEQIELAPDVVTHMLPGEKHGIENVGQEPLEFIFIYVPSGPEKGILNWRLHR